MKNKITVTGANTLFFIFVVLFLIFQVVLVAFSAFYGVDFIDRNIYDILLVNQYILILIPVLLFVLVRRLDFRDIFRINGIGLLPAVLIILCSLPAYLAANFINMLVIYLLQFIGNIPTQPIPVPQNFYELAVGILIVAVSPAICEEMLHRGVLLRAYEKRGTMKALVITSIIFGFFHFDVTNFFGPVFLGLLIGYYVIRTNSIFAGVLAHFLNNAIAEILQFISRSEGPAPKTITIPLFDLGVSFAYGIIGVFFLWLLLTAFRRVTEGKSIINPPITNYWNDFVSVISHWPIITVLVLYMLLGGLYLLTIIADKFELLDSLAALSQISTFLF